MATRKPKDIDPINTAIKNINKKLKNVQVQSASQKEDGKLEMSLLVTPENARQVLGTMNESGIDMPAPIINRREVASSLITRDVLSDDWLDLKKADILSEPAHNLYQRAIEYYKKEDVYGSMIDVLTNFAMAGFKNDIEDVNIKDFFDNWVVDVGFDEIVEQIFFEFFRTGFVRTYKLLGKYEPKINYVSTIPGQAPKTTKEKATLTSVPASSEIPVKYTILNPRMVILESALFSDAQNVLLKKEAGAALKKWMDGDTEVPLSQEQKDILKKLPAKMKTAIKKEQDIPLEPELVGKVDYRTQPYEVYPIPRGVRAFTSMEYKRDLRRADSSTLDGITNYILLITVGNDQNPVKSTDTLEEVASMFDTPAKAFDVVYNHTLNVKKIVSPEIGDILGQDKYKQVNEDITGSWGVIRAAIDGVGDYNSSAVEVAIKSLEQEVYYARRKVQRWIYNEYMAVATAMGFDRYPKVRFDKMILKNELQMFTVIQGLIDRRLISYQAGLEMLGFDYETILSQLREEAPLVLAGILGIIGSPYNQKATPNAFNMENVQDVQGTPKGTPSEGRPKGKVAPTPKPAETPKSAEKTDKETQANLSEAITSLSRDELSDIILLLKKELGNRE